MKAIEFLNKNYDLSNYKELDNQIKLMNDFAKIKCEEQREICSKSTERCTDNPSGEYPIITEQSVLNAKEPEF